MTDDKKPKAKRRSRKTPVAGTPEAATPAANEAPPDPADAATDSAEPSPGPAGRATEASDARQDPQTTGTNTGTRNAIASAEAGAPTPAASGRDGDGVSFVSFPDTGEPASIASPSGPAFEKSAEATPSPSLSGNETKETPSPSEARNRAARTSDLEAEPPAVEEHASEGERRVRQRRATDRRPGSEAAPIAIDYDGWPLDPSEALGGPGELPPAPPTPLQQMPSPAAAAYEAARIVGEMVGDIESAPGAALVAAAAAGAAIEVARARVAAGEADRSLASSVSAADAASTDPVVTQRIQRDRILRALAEDVAANATSTATAESAAAAASSATMPAMTDRASSQPGLAPSARGEPSRAPSHAGRAATQPPRDDAMADEADEGLDPVAIAAAAIARLRERARTDLAELRVHYHRHDILVLLVAFVIIVVAGRVHDALVTTSTVPFEPGGEHGLTFEHSRGWLTSPGGPLPPPRIAHEVAGSSAKPSATLVRVELTSTIDPTARIEVMIDKKPAWSNIVTGLDLDRRTRWGELYTLDDSSVRSVEDHQWLRTAYRFAHVLDKGDVPRIDRAVEYATIDREQIYVITFFGTPAEIERIEDVVAPTLRVATQTGLPLVPQTGHLSTRKYPNAVAHAFDATVMVVVADIVDGRLHARGGGSGVIVGKDGSILTNYHVIHDKNGRLHDVFVIGRFSDQDKAPQLHCAGKPSRSKLQRELDLALIKCDLDLDGRSWSPTSGATTWATLPEARTADIKMGQRIWVLGYPDVGGGGLTLAEGEALGWSGVDGAAGKDFLKTDAAIRHGNSGGPVVDDAGRLVGIASAVRTKQNAAGDIIEVVQAGGRVRPIAAATDLLAIAAAGWTPREGHTDVDLQPSAIEAPAEGVQIQSRVLDVVNEAPIRDALVMVLRPGVNATTVDVNRLDDQVLSYGRSNAQGEVLLKQPVPVPGTYTLMVVARGYEPVIGEGDLTLEANTPAVFDPWGKLLLRAR
jgi:S1-C subfamily serine protease